MIKLMGEKSGFTGISLAFFPSSAAAGHYTPPFPFRSLVEKGQ